MKKKGYKKHSSEFKAKIALSVLRDEASATELAQQHKLHVTQIYKWKRQLLDNMARAFDGEEASSAWSEREAELLRKIGELTLERDFLSRGLGRSR